MLFFIYGTDHYRVNQKLKEVKEGFIQKRDKSGLNVISLDGEKLEFDQFQQEVMTTPFLGEKKMIIVKNLLKNRKSTNSVLEFLKTKKEIDNMVVFVELLNPEKKAVPTGALFNYLKKQKYSWGFNQFKNHELKKWLTKYLTENKIKIEPKAIDELTIVVGNDLNQMTLEIKKLSAYKDGDIIKVEDVKQLVKAKYNDNIFELVDAIGQKNKNQALRLVSDQLNSGSHPLSVLTMIIRQFRILLNLKDNPKNTMKLHPFVFKKTSTQSKNFSQEKLKTIYQELLEMESQLKSSSKNPELLFGLFIMKNC